ncbi:hypothetical protein [Phenylobacterium montanum]|uniref:Glycerophosphoryl diester phosphodiesterase membrane domain-containing protein n=1 Tax=Phenylobacterium montanum TaxID=2823693 RepID=A0A975IV04_9CAUL|nr:hypothetical protein [Caulobacter sp. S6]QUD88487.1 hypothetical protein KCG34_00920 [Caulobacter sp. S6]
MTKVSGSAAISAAFNFIGPGWRAAWAILLLYGVCSFALQIWLAAVTDVAAAITTPAALAANSGKLWQGLPLGLMAMAASTATYGALYRAGLGQADENGPGGLQWKAAEWRILGAVVLLVAMVALPISALFVAIFGSMAASVKSSPAAAIAMAGWLGLLFLILAPLVIWVSVRISPYLAATVDQKRIVVFGAWDLTRGAFWPIFGALIVVGIASALVVGFGQIVGLTIRATEGAIADPTPNQMVLPALVQAAAAILILPAKVGLMAYVYRAVRPATPAVEEVFA